MDSFVKQVFKHYLRLQTLNTIECDDYWKGKYTIKQAISPKMLYANLVLIVIFKIGKNVISIIGFFKDPKKPQKSLNWKAEKLFFHI